MTPGTTFSHDPPKPALSPAVSASLRPGRGWELHPGVRSGRRLTRGERAADVARNIVGSWTFLLALILLLAAGVAVAATRAWLVTTFGVALAGLALVGVSLLLIVARRADRTASEWALHDLDHARRAAAAADELRAEVEGLRAELARLTARVETTNRRPPEGRSTDDVLDQAAQ
jgi:uncharacterized membrane protein